MAEYTFHLCSALTDTIIAELPAVGASFTESLNSAGTAVVTTPLDLGNFEVGVIEPLRQSIFILRDGVPVWGGIIWVAQMNVAENTMTLSCMGFWSLMAGRRITTSVTFTDTDQALIVKSLVDTAQAVPNGDMLIDTSALAAVGKLRTRQYFGYEKKSVGEAVEQMAAVRDGFDFAVRPTLEAGAYVRKLSVSYPATGRRTQIVLDAGANMELLNVTSDATTMVTTMHAKGEGEGNLAAATTQANPGLLSTYPMVEGLVVLSDVGNLTTLIAHANRALDLGKRPMVIPSVVISGDSEPHIGSYQVGDRVRVRASYGALNLDDTYRITSWSATVDVTGRESVSMFLAPLEVFQNV